MGEENSPEAEVTGSYVAGQILPSVIRPKPLDYSQVVLILSASGVTEGLIDDVLRNFLEKGHSPEAQRECIG